MLNFLELVWNSCLHKQCHHNSIKGDEMTISWFSIVVNSHCTSIVTGCVSLEVNIVVKKLRGDKTSIAVKKLSCELITLWFGAVVFMFSPVKWNATSLNSLSSHYASLYTIKCFRIYDSQWTYHLMRSLFVPRARSSDVVPS